MHPIDGPVDEGYLVRDKKPDLGQQYQKKRKKRKGKGKGKGKGTPALDFKQKIPGARSPTNLLVSADGVTYKLLNS